MLTPDLIYARRSGDKLSLADIDAKKPHSEMLARELLVRAESSQGLTRKELHDRWAEVHHRSQDRKLYLGLRKLIESALVFQNDFGISLTEVRSRVFELSTELRKAGLWNRGRVLKQVAEQYNLDTAVIDRDLYADLKHEQRVERVEDLALLSPHTLLRSYQDESARAVLLKATRLDLRFKGSSAELRQVLNTLKFHQLMFTATKVDDIFAIEVTGPMSILSATTKYGLALAKALPRLLSFGKIEVTAALRWGKDRTPLSFQVATGAGTVPLSGSDRVTDQTGMPEAFATLAKSWPDKSLWRFTSNVDVVTTQRGAVLVPDGALQHQDGRVVLVENLGFWNREGVFRRFDVAKEGLEVPYLVCAPQKLRVSEEALEIGKSSKMRLMIYRTTLTAAALIEAAELCFVGAPSGTQRP